MSERYVDELGRALRERGAPRGLRTRFVSEARDHLLEAEAERRPLEFGDAGALAQQVVDELAGSGAKRAALLSAAALAPAAGLYAVLLLLGSAAGSPDIFSGRTDAVALPAALALIVAPQVSLAAGALALLRVLRRRGRVVLPQTEVSVLVRRVSTALVFGAATVASLTLYAYEFDASLAWCWRDIAYAAPAALALPLAVAAISVRRTARLRTAAPGEAGDVFADLPEATLVVDSPWRLCLVFAGTVAAVVFVAGALAGAADEGVRNAVAEFVAVVVAFAALGRFLGCAADDVRPPGQPSRSGSAGWPSRPM
jgi:hypothetical protein